MPKPDPALLDPARYPYHCTVETRFGDMDINHHVNNVAMVQIFEEARVRFFRASKCREVLGKTRTIMASIAVEYLAEAFYPQVVDSYCAVLKVGRTSYTVAQLAMQNGQPVAFAQGVLIAGGPDGPIVLPDRFREAIVPWTMAA